MMKLIKGSILNKIQVAAEVYGLGDAETIS